MAKQWRPLSPRQRCKYECARELGLLERLQQVGWAGLTAKESGRIGGCMSRKDRG